MPYSSLRANPTATGAGPRGCDQIVVPDIKPGAVPVPRGPPLYPARICAGVASGSSGSWRLALGGLPDWL